MNLFFMIAFLPLLPAILSALGGIGATVGSGIASSKMRAYNDPAKQLQRLNQAGLPMAAMGGSLANTQSQIPDFSGIAQAGEGLGGFLQNYQTQTQIDLMKEQIRNAQIGGNISFLDFLTKNEDTRFNLSPAEGYDNKTNRWVSNQMDQDIKTAARWIEVNKQTISALETGLAEARFKSGDMDKKWQEEFDAIVNKNKLMKQLYDNVESEKAAANRIRAAFEEGGLTLAEAFFMELMRALSGGVSNKGANIGF